MTTLTITHNHESGTLLHGTARGDGSAQALKQVRGWRWSRNVGWYVRSSRDRNANQALVEATRAALAAAGFTVEVEVDDTFRPAAEVEADRERRAEDRAAALADKAQRKATDAAAAYTAHQRACDHVPPGGEPIHVGHYSERRHRNAIDKAWKTLGKAVNAGEEAERVEARAEAAAKANARRHNPVTVKNRIDKLQADQRRDQRQVDGYRRVVHRTADGREYADESPPAAGTYRAQVLARMAQRAGQIDHWLGVYAQLQEDGVATSYGRDNVAKGDHIKYRGHWYEVVRANAKSVSVHLQPEWSWTHKIGYHEITDRRGGQDLTTLDDEGGRSIADKILDILADEDQAARSSSTCCCTHADCTHQEETENKS